MPVDKEATADAGRSTVGDGVGTVGPPLQERRGAAGAGTAVVRGEGNGHRGPGESVGSVRCGGPVCLPAPALR